ncbi:zinc finger protein 501-like [Eublepharis macularius]|uniref:Zinc finger protein 501-like n=1 Tax=Eublepharis macularius TaxID=481883 RepID=A0AA97KU14_EUBMA|nr:zinc finger protein 501-like [Eublepharis macularius]
MLAEKTKQPEVEEYSGNQEVRKPREGNQTQNAGGDLHTIQIQQETKKEKGKNESPVCSKNVSSKLCCNVHQRIHTEGRTHIWSECGKAFDERTQLDRHQKIHTREKAFISLVHGKILSQKANNDYQRIHTGEKLYNCSDCNKGFSNKSGLLQHQRIHTRENQYIWMEQGENNNQSACLTSHQSINSGISDYGETIHDSFQPARYQINSTIEKSCKNRPSGKSHRWNAELTSHQTVHRGNRPYNCLDCGQNFCNASNLARHQRIHTGEKPYKCFECGKSFGQKTNLIRHQGIHTGAKPYQCSECGKSFRWKVQLISHQTVHTGESPYQCLDCGQNFSSSSNLTRHQRIHTVEKPYKHWEHETHFNQSTSLTSHENVHTGAKQYHLTEWGQSVNPSQDACAMLCPTQPQCSSTLSSMVNKHDKGQQHPSLDATQFVKLYFGGLLKSNPAT